MRVEGEGYTLICGDCREWLPTLAAGSVDSIICDLPYGTTACAWDSVIPLDKLWPEFKRVIKPRGAVVLFGSQPFTSALVMSNLEWFRYSLVWHKSRSTGFLDANKKPLKNFEDISVFYSAQCTFNPQKFKGKPNHIKNGLQPDSKRASHYGFYRLTERTKTDDKYPGRVLKFSSLDPAQMVHPTQKPVDLLATLWRLSPRPAPGA